MMSVIHVTASINFSAQTLFELWPFMLLGSVCLNIVVPYLPLNPKTHTKFCSIPGKQD